MESPALGERREPPVARVAVGIGRICRRDRRADHRLHRALAGVPLPARQRRAQARHRRGGRDLGRRWRGPALRLVQLPHRAAAGGRLSPGAALPLRRSGPRPADLVPGPADGAHLLDQPLQCRQLAVRRHRQLHQDLHHAGDAGDLPQQPAVDDRRARPASVVFGLLIAVLADRSRFEAGFKSIIFMPMAISFVGAGIIWNFMYEVRDANQPQIGLSTPSSWPWAGSPRPGRRSSSRGTTSS